MGKKQILARPTGIQKEKKMWSAMNFSETTKQPQPKKALKYKECIAISFQI